MRACDNFFLSLRGQKPSRQYVTTGVPMQLTKFLKTIGDDNSGGTAIEYGLIAALIVIASIGAFDAVANENTGLWAVVSDKVTSNIGN